MDRIPIAVVTLGKPCSCLVVACDPRKKSELTWIQVWRIPASALHIRRISVDLDELIQGDRIRRSHDDGDMEENGTSHGNQKKEVIHRARLVDIREWAQLDEGHYVGDNEAGFQNEVGYQIVDVVFGADGEAIPAWPRRTVPCWWRWDPGTWIRRKSHDVTWQTGTCACDWLDSGFHLEWRRRFWKGSLGLVLNCFSTRSLMFM